MRQINFYPGPAALPPIVLERFRDAILDFNGTGIGILEMSHRSSGVINLIHESIARFKRLLGDNGDEYEILFCTGGAHNQFSMVPYNLLSAQDDAAYLISGLWAKKAYAEALKIASFGSYENETRVFVAGSSEDGGFKSLPKITDERSPIKYLHYTSNNTIYGTQYDTPPKVRDSVALVADRSSDLFQGPLEIKKYGLIYASAQKNLGAAGVTVVIIRRDLLEAISGDERKRIPVMLDYQNYAKHESSYNTPPIGAIYIVNETLKWIEGQGLDRLYALNKDKAYLIYRVLDEHKEVYRPYVHPNCRSLMNITFNLSSENLEKRFLNESKLHGFIGLEGHRSIGGVRVSLYNATTLRDAESLAGFMRKFAKEG
jgi:phosphoserine aminotransferase